MTAARTVKRKPPTNAQIRRALIRYGQRINEGEARRAQGIPNSIRTVNRYCAALKVVWDMASAMAKPNPRPKSKTRRTRNGR